MIPQPACMDSGGHEIMAQGIHHHKGRQSGRVAKIIPELTLGKCRTGGRFYGDDPRLFSVYLVMEKRERHAAKVASPAAATDNHIRIITNHLELLLRLDANHALVQNNVI